MLPLSVAARKNIYEVNNSKKFIKKILAATERGNIVKIKSEFWLIFYWISYRIKSNSELILQSIRNQTQKKLKTFKTLIINNIIIAFNMVLKIFSKIIFEIFLYISARVRANVKTDGLFRKLFCFWYLINYAFIS